MALVPPQTSQSDEPQPRMETGAGRLAHVEDAPGGTEMPAISGTVKWFDATRGFGFLVCDAVEGDVLLHFSVLREHGRRSLPEGGIVGCSPVRLDRGLQAKRVLSIDLRSAVGTPPRTPSAAERADRKALAERAGDHERVEVKWFNRVKGYGFLTRVGQPESGDIFVHMETVREAGLGDLQPGDSLLARIATSNKGLTAIELRAES